VLVFVSALLNLCVLYATHQSLNGFRVSNGSVITGNAMVGPRGPVKKVLNSTADDNVFIYFTGERCFANAHFLLFLCLFCANSVH
jgi:hypothetical protein